MSTGNLEFLFELGEKLDRLSKDLNDYRESFPLDDAEIELSGKILNTIAIAKMYLEKHLSQLG